MGCLLRAKGFTFISPIEKHLVFVPRFDRFMKFQRHGLLAEKMVLDLNSTFFFNESLCLNELTSQRMSCSFIIKDRN